MRDLIIKVVTRFMIPYIQLYGAYVIFNGHLSPGGGFAGGTIIAASLILYILAFGLKHEQQRLPENWTQTAESLGAILFCLVGILGILLGSKFLANRAAGFSLGILGRVSSGGIIFLLTIFIGVKVASTMVTLFSHLADDEGEG